MLLFVVGGIITHTCTQKDQVDGLESGAMVDPNLTTDKSDQVKKV